MAPIYDAFAVTATAYADVEKKRENGDLAIETERDRFHPGKLACLRDSLSARIGMENDWARVKETETYLCFAAAARCFVLNTLNTLRYDVWK